MYIHTYVRTYIHTYIHNYISDRMTHKHIQSKTFRILYKSFDAYIYQIDILLIMIFVYGITCIPITN